LSEESLTLEDFEHPEARALYEALQRAYAADELAPDPIAAGHAVRPPASLNPDEAKTFNGLAFLAEREFQGWSLDQLKRELNTDVAQLRLLHKKREREHIEQMMREAERLGDQARIKELLEQFARITKND
jgi:hypothetical protein